MRSLPLAALDGTVEGEVSQELFWVDTLDDEPAEDKRHTVSAADRGLIECDGVRYEITGRKEWRGRRVGIEFSAVAAQV